MSNNFTFYKHAKDVIDKPLYSDTLYKNNFRVVIKIYGPNLDQL